MSDFSKVSDRINYWEKKACVEGKDGNERKKTPEHIRKILFVKCLE